MGNKIVLIKMKLMKNIRNIKVIKNNKKKRKKIKLLQYLNLLIFQKKKSNRIIIEEIKTKNVRLKMKISRTLFILDEF